MNDKAAEVEAARENLQKVTVDMSELKEVIKTAKAISSEGYTKESFEALQQGIREAEALLNGTYTQDEVNEKTAILKQRISGLRADKTALQEKYDKIKDMTQGQATDESNLNTLKTERFTEYNADKSLTLPAENRNSLWQKKMETS